MMLKCLITRPFSSELRLPPYDADMTLWEAPTNSSSSSLPETRVASIFSSLNANRSAQSLNESLASYTSLSTWFGTKRKRAPSSSVKSLDDPGDPKDSVEDTHIPWLSSDDSQYQETIIDSSIPSPCTPHSLENPSSPVQNDHRPWPTPSYSHPQEPVLPPVPCSPAPRPSSLPLLPIDTGERETRSSEGPFVSSLDPWFSPSDLQEEDADYFADSTLPLGNNKRLSTIEECSETLISIASNRPKTVIEDNGSVPVHRLEPDEDEDVLESRDNDSYSDMVIKGASEVDMDGFKGQYECFDIDEEELDGQYECFDIKYCPRRR